VYELAACLFGKIWGEVLMLAAIINKTKKDWSFMKGQISYIEVENDWILVRFANADGHNLVFQNRSCFVNALNFVLLPWVPFFDPLLTTIDKVDQWIRIPRFPWEFWDQASLETLLSCVGKVVHVDHNTLFRKGKFAHVCVHIDVTQPLPGSLNISSGGRSMQVPIIYEGLHEVRLLCGGDPHQLDSCPKLPLNKKIEVMAEKFDAQDLGGNPDPMYQASSSTPVTAENWVTVTLRKRLRASFGPRGQRPMSAPRSSAGPSNLVGSNVLGKFSLGEPLDVAGNTHKSSSHSVDPLNDSGIILANPKLLSTLMEPPINTDPLKALEEDELPEDGIGQREEDIFHHLPIIKDVAMSADSTKRKRHEDGNDPTWT